MKNHRLPTKSLYYKPHEKSAIMITVDKKTFKSKAKALNFFLNGMLACDGSEQERMTFAYCAIAEGKTNIDTYRETAE